MLLSLQFLRGMAAVAVVLYHARLQYSAMGGSSDLFVDLAQYGYVGVDIFFVISGFVMALTTYNKCRDLSSASVFLQKRLFRVYLGYWPFFILMLLATWILVPTKLESIDLVGSFFLSSTNINNLLLGVTWTLSYELLFYCLVFSLFLFALRTANWILLGLFAFITFANLTWPVLLNPGTKFFLSAFILEFIAGYFLFSLFQGNRSMLWAIIFAGLMVFGFWYGVDLGAKAGLVRVYSFGVGSFGLVAFTIWLEKNNFIRYPKVFTLLGDASYSIYLSHIPLLMFFYWSGLRNWLRDQPQWVTESGFVGFVLFIIGFSLIFHIVIEHPLYAGALRRFGIRPSSRHYP